VRAARNVADQIGKPVMIHVGSLHSPMDQILELARPADIVTHAFRPHTREGRGADHDRARKGDQQDRRNGFAQTETFADIAVWDVVQGNFSLVDSQGEVRKATQKLVPVLALRRGWIP
jgi:predicted amidohydrolase